MHAAFFILMTLTVPLQMFVCDIWINASQLTVFLGMVAYLASAPRRVFSVTSAQAVWCAAVMSGLHVLVLAGVLVQLWFVFTCD